MPDISTRLSNTGQLLVRSGIEIERILTSMVQDRDAVTAKLPAQQMFLSRLVCVDAEEQHVILACSDHKPANSAVLAAPSVNLLCNHRGAKFAFACNRPRPGAHSGRPVIRMAAPSIMLALQAGRAPVRAPVPGEADVRCEIRMGLLSFNARLVDMGLDGTAYILGPAAIPVCAGTRLQDVRLRHGPSEPLTADIEVHEVKQAAVLNGRPATRIGCRILAGRQQIEEIVRLFIIDLE